MSNIIKLLLVLFCFSAASAQELIPRETLFTGDTYYNFKAAQDGKALFFESRSNNRQVISWINAQVPGKIEAINLPRPAISWIPFKDGILAVTQGEFDDLYFYSRSESHQKLPMPAGTAVIKVLATSQQHPNQIALQITSEVETTSGIYQYDCEKLTWEKKYNLQPIASLFFDDALELVAGHGRNNLGGLSTSLYQPEKDSWETLVEHPYDESIFLSGFQKVVAVSNDGSKVYYISNLNTDKNKLMVYHIKTKESTLLAEDNRVDLIPFGTSINGKGEVSSIVGLFAKTIRKVIDPSCQPDFDFLEEKIKGDIGFVGADVNDQVWFVREFTGGPAKFYAYHRSTKQLTYLINDYPALDGHELATRKAFSVPTRDGAQLPVHVYLPPGADEDGNGIPDRPLPTVMYVHGGPWVGLVHWNQYFHWRNFQLLANRGYAVINCEFRGSTGLGKTFVDQSNKQWGGTMMHDKVDIAHWAAKQGIAPADSIGIWGWSYGGYATMAGLALSPETYRCGIAMYGISDLDAFCRKPFANTDLWRNRVGDVSIPEDVKLLQSHSPINFVDQIRAPLLLTTGSQDARVPQVQMDTIAQALENQQKEVVYFYYPEEGHDYISPESWISFWAIGEKFLADHLGGKRQKAGSDLAIGNYVVVQGEEYVGDIN